MIDNPNGSVVKQPPVLWGSASDVVLWLAQRADEIPAWGKNFRTRDIKLREFYKQEPYASSAIYTVAARRAGMKYVLHGPERQRTIVQRILHNSEHGFGWIPMMMKYIKDLLTQDNGGFLEIIHVDKEDPTSPVIQLNHLDAARCIRTGNWDTPVIYQDIMGEAHYLKHWQVACGNEYPDPDERARGYQQCALSRMLLKAQTMRDIGIFESEKIGGRNPSTIHLVGGVQQQRLESILALRQNEADQQGLLHYLSSPIIAALDPTARVTHVQVDLKGVPEGYDPEKALRWYTLLLALALGVDPQEIAPLPGGNLGSAQQSQVLRETARSKGHALFMEHVEHMMNFHGILPKTIEFKYAEQDISEDEQRTMLQWRRAQMYRLYAGSPTQTEILPPTVIRQMMRDNGDLNSDQLALLGEQDVTPITQAAGDDKLNKGLLSKLKTWR